MNISDFDQNIKKIERHKKLTARSEWSRNVGFVSTDSRFRNDISSEGPTPMTYIVNHFSITTPAPSRASLAGAAFGAAAKVWLWVWVYIHTHLVTSDQFIFILFAFHFNLIFISVM